MDLEITGNRKKRLGQLLCEKEYLDRSNLDVARESIDGRYVMSIKPTPAAVAMQPFDEDVIRAEINNQLDKTAGKPTEFILKDISTVKGEPERIDMWNRVVSEEIDKRFS